MDGADQTPTSRPSFLDAQKDAALAQVREQQEEHRKVADIVLGASRTSTRRSVTEVINLGGDYLVEVTDHRVNQVMWTFVIGGKTTNWHHERQEDAILHLIAARYDDNPNSNVHAAFYAGRVLGLPADQR